MTNSKNSIFCSFEQNPTHFTHSIQAFVKNLKYSDLFLFVYLNPSRCLARKIMIYHSSDHPIVVIKKLHRKENFLNFCVEPLKIKKNTFIIKKMKKLYAKHETVGPRNCGI